MKKLVNEPLSEQKQLTEAYYNQQQREKEKLQSMMHFSQRFLDTESVPDLQEITQFMRTLTGAFSAVYNEFEENGSGFITKAIAVKNQHLLKAVDILGFNPIGKRWSHDQNQQAKIQQEMVTTYENLQSIAANNLPVQLSRLLEKTFDIGQVIIVKTIKKDKVFGYFTLVMPKGKSMESQELAILYATQVGMHLDRVQYEEDLRKQQQRLEGIIEGTHVATWEWNVKTGETVFNERWAEMVGYALAELEPTTINTWKSFVYPEDELASETQLQEVLSGNKEYYDVEYRLIHRSGHLIWVHDRGKVITWSEDGKPLLASGTHTDITQRKRAEETLVSSKEQLETLSNNIPNGMVYQLTVDPQGNRRFTYVSAGVEQVHGVTQAEVMHHSKILYDQVLEGDRQKLIKTEERAFQNLESFSCEARIRKPDGEIRWVQFMSSLSKKPEGNIVAEGIEIDITDLKNAEKKLQEYANLLELKNQELDMTAQEAEKANLAKSRYLAHMNHEIRTPLNGLLGFLQLMETTNMDELQQEYMEYMKQSTSHLLNIINNVLDMAKIEAGEMQLKNRIFNVREEINTALAPLHSLASQNNIHMQVTIDESLPYQMKGDPDRLRQIALNLGGNAVKFTKKGQVHIAIRCLETTETHHAVQLMVEDTGSGMTRETLDKMFLPFYQADDGSTPQSKGTGLGMTITRELVEMMNGEIRVDSTPGKGTRIEVRLILGKATDSDSGSNLI